MSSVGTQNDDGELAMRSRKAWYRATQRWSSVSSASNRPGRVQPRSCILSMKVPWRRTCARKPVQRDEQKQSRIRTHRQAEVERKGLAARVAQRDVADAVQRVDSRQDASCTP